MCTFERTFTHSFWDLACLTHFILPWTGVDLRSEVIIYSKQPPTEEATAWERERERSQPSALTENLLWKAIAKRGFFQERGIWPTNQLWWLNPILLLGKKEPTNCRAGSERKEGHFVRFLLEWKANKNCFAWNPCTFCAIFDHPYPSTCVRFSSPRTGISGSI